MKTVSAKEFIKILERKGWNLKRINGSQKNILCLTREKGN